MTTANRLTKYINGFFKDRHGKWAIVQWPNMLLWLWIAMVAMELLIHDMHLKESISLLQSAALFAWAYMEVIEGVSYFRKTLGVIVLTVVISGFFGK